MHASGGVKSRGDRYGEKKRPCGVSRKANSDQGYGARDEGEGPAVPGYSQPLSELITPTFWQALERKPVEALTALLARPITVALPSIFTSPLIAPMFWSALARKP